MILIPLLFAFDASATQNAIWLCDNTTPPSSLSDACDCITSNKAAWYAPFSVTQKADMNSGTFPDACTSALVDENTCFDWYGTLGLTRSTTRPLAPNPNAQDVYDTLHAMGYNRATSPVPLEPGQTTNSLIRKLNTGLMGAQCDGNIQSPAPPEIIVNGRLDDDDTEYYDGMGVKARVLDSTTLPDHTVLADVNGDNLVDLVVVFAEEAWLLLGPLGPSATFLPPE